MKQPPKKLPDVAEVGGALLNSPEMRQMLSDPEYGGMAALGLFLIILRYVPPKSRRVLLARAEALARVYTETKDW